MSEVPLYLAPGTGLGGDDVARAGRLLLWQTFKLQSSILSILIHLERIAVLPLPYRGTSPIRKRQPPLAPQQESRHGPTVGSYGGGRFLMTAVPLYRRQAEGRNLCFEIHKKIQKFTLSALSKSCPATFGVSLHGDDLFRARSFNPQRC